jgi:capsular polysaccharide biosynthesis protein
MKICYLENGIKINYNHNETNIETIFSLTQENNIIQGFTFPCDIFVNKDEFDANIQKCKTIILENGFLFYSFRYEISFAHYMTQTVPKLYEYINTYRNYKLLIPKNKYNNLCKDILQMLNISNENIYILEDKTIYIINDYATSNTYHAPPGNFTSNHLWIYKKIREPLNIVENMNPYKRIYLKRDGISNIHFGNSETGIKRQIINENELIHNLIKMNFEIVHLGDKYINEKKQILENSKIIITSLGANCLNLIFSNAPKNIIILSNHNNFGYQYYTSLSEQLNNEQINCKFIQYNTLYNNDNLNQWNGCFSVNIDEINDCIKSME